MIYKVLDWVFVVFHTLLIFFNLFGWVWKPLRLWNLFTLLLTGLSWSLLGIVYGLGYCPLTDWHWEVLYKLGKYPETSSYVAYLLKRLLLIDITDNMANLTTLLFYLAALGVSVFLNLRDWRRKYSHFNG